MGEQTKLNAHIWAKAEHEFYVEPSWTATRLLSMYMFHGPIHDPCCGLGTIPEAALSLGVEVTGADIRTENVWEFAAHQEWQNDETVYDNIVTNPPFTPCNAIPFPFVEWALSHSRYQCALLLPLKWLTGDKRSRWLEKKPLKYVYVMAPRPSMPPGAVILAGEKPGGGKKDFAWYIFEHGYTGEPIVRWLRKR